MIENIRQWLPSIVSVLSFAFFLGISYSEIKQLRKDIDTHIKGDDTKEMGYMGFKEKLLNDLGKVQGAIESMQKTVTGGKVIEKKNGTRVIIWKDESEN